MINDTKEIFKHWQMRMNRSKSKLIDKRIRCIKNRLKEGYTKDDIKQAIDGCAKSGFHMGENNSSRVYNDITLICRSGDKVEGFMDIYNQPDRPPNGSHQQNNRKESLAERAARQTDEIFANTAPAEVDSGPMGAHDGSFRQQVGIESGSAKRARQAWQGDGKLL